MTDLGSLWLAGRNWLIGGWGGSSVAAYMYILLIQISRSGKVVDKETKVFQEVLAEQNRSTQQAGVGENNPFSNNCHFYPPGWVLYACLPLSDNMSHVLTFVDIAWHVGGDERPVQLEEEEEEEADKGKKHETLPTFTEFYCLFPPIFVWKFVQSVQNYLRFSLTNACHP